jgi:hypothetical protein
MATLTITKLECVKKRDPIGRDEVDIWVAVDGGSEVWLSGPHALDKSRNDDEVRINAVQVFTDTVRIRLKERDGARGGSNDLDLGTKTVHHDETYPDTYPFSGNNGRVAYNLSYNVTQ